MPKGRVIAIDIITLAGSHKPLSGGDIAQMVSAVGGVVNKRVVIKEYLGGEDGKLMKSWDFGPLERIDEFQDPPK